MKSIVGPGSRRLTEEFFARHAIDESGHPTQSVRARKLVFLRNSLERLGSALDPIGQTLVAFDRQLANDLIYATGGIVSELRLEVDALASRIFVAHVRPFEWAPVCATEAGYDEHQQKRPAR
jgi:hypothetical protein